MKISGFTMCRNASKLYYPIEAAIRSILPIVDEFVVALGEGDSDDDTESIINSIGSKKIRIIRTEWDIVKYPRGMENAHQTDIAKEHCKGDWLFYLQADEVVHERYLETITRRCESLLLNSEVEGLLFSYRHFWGDYDHYHNSYGWYPQEIRIVRNNPEIHSWRSAQSFRRIPGFDGVNYRVEEGTHKLRVAKVDAEIYHYGWVRPPKLMQSKKKSLDTIHKGMKTAEDLYKDQRKTFDYGPLGSLPRFEGTHPEVMRSFISNFDWADELNQTSIRNEGPMHKHEKFRTKVLTLLQRYLPLGSRNYVLLDV